MGCGGSSSGSVSPGGIDFGALSSANDETNGLLEAVATDCCEGKDPAPLLASVLALRADCEAIDCAEDPDAVTALNDGVTDLKIAVDAVIVEYTDCKAKLDLILPAVEKWIETSGDTFAKSCAAVQTVEAKATFADFVMEEVKEASTTLDNIRGSVNDMNADLTSVTNNDNITKLNDIKIILLENGDAVDKIDELLIIEQAKQTDLASLLTTMNETQDDMTSVSNTMMNRLPNDYKSPCDTECE